MGMTINEVIKWLSIMKANLNSFPEVSNAKKIEALAEAIRLLKNEQSKEPSSSEIPTGSDNCISRQDVLSEIIRFSTEEGSSVECQQLYCDVNNMPPVTPIRPKGHWIETAEEYYKAINEKGGGVNENTDYFVDDIACSECLAKFSVIDNEAERFDFCPACGADMRGEE